MIVLFFLALCSCTTQYSIYPYLEFNTSEPNMLAFGDFSPQWTVLNMLAETPTPDLKTIKFYKNNSLSGTLALQGDNKKIQGHFLNDFNSSRYFALDFSSTLRVYESQNFTLAFTAPSGVADATFTSQKHQIVYMVSWNHTLNKIDCNNNYTVVKDQNLTHSPVQLVWSAMKLLVYAMDVGTTTLGYVSIYSEDLTFLTQIQVNAANTLSYVYFDGSTFAIPINHTLNLETNGNYLVRSYWNTVQVWNITSGQLVHTKSMTEQVFSAMICNQILAVLRVGYVDFYEYGTWSYFKNEPYTFGTDVAYMKCFESSSSIGVYSPNQNLVITYFRATLNSSSTPPSPGTGNWTNTTEINNYTIPTNQTLKEEYSEQPGVLSQFMNSSSFKETTSVVSQVVAVASAASIGSSLRPFSSFIQEFVFYSYHTKVYPPLVEILITQADILNELRIKPNFMNFKIPNAKIDSSNKRYLAFSSFSPKRAPDMVYFADFLKENIIQNIILVSSSYIGFLLIYKLAQKMKKYFSSWKFVYAYMNRKVVWWNFLVMLFSNNVRTFSFYCFVQLSILVSYDFVDKIGMVASVLMLFLLFVFSFGFYLLLFRYSKAKFSRQVLQICKFSFSSFMVEMSLNTVRGFSQSLIHGSFANRHDLQIVGLILIDFLVICLAVKLRKLFNSQVMGFLVISYLCAYLAFDVFLALYSFNRLQNYSFQTTFTIILFSLIGITMMKMAYLMIETIVQAIKSLKKSNKIKTVGVDLINIKKIQNKKQNLIVEQIPPSKQPQQGQKNSNHIKASSQNIFLRLEIDKSKLKLNVQRQNTKSLWE